MRKHHDLTGASGGLSRSPPPGVAGGGGGAGVEQGGDHPVLLGAAGAGLGLGDGDQELDDAEGGRSGQRPVSGGSGLPQRRRLPLLAVRRRTAGGSLSCDSQEPSAARG